MSRFEDPCRDVGIRPELFLRLGREQQMELAQMSFRVLARARHSDVSESPGISSTERGHDAFSVLTDSYKRIKEWDEAAELAGVHDLLQGAFLDISSAAERCSQLGHVASDCVLAPLLKQPTAQNLPAGTMTLFNYLAHGLRDTIDPRTLAQRADSVRDIAEIEKASEEDMYDWQMSYGSPELLVHCDIDVGGWLKATPERQLVGFLYAHDLYRELESIARDFQLSFGQVRGAIPSECFGHLLSLFSPKLVHPDSADKGIFPVSLLRSGSSAFYRIEGELLGFAEEGLDE